MQENDEIGREERETMKSNLVSLIKENLDELK
jgi:hypothetical protein